jgi:hypothetical protein
VISIPGRTFPVKEFFLEDVIESLQYTEEDAAEYSRHTYDASNLQSTSLNVTSKGGISKKVVVEWDEELVHETQDPNDYCDPKLYTELTRNVIKRLDHSKINYDLIERILLHINDPKGQYPSIMEYI